MTQSIALPQTIRPRLASMHAHCQWLLCAQDCSILKSEEHVIVTWKGNVIQGSTDSPAGTEYPNACPSMLLQPVAPVNHVYWLVSSQTPAGASSLDLAHGHLPWPGRTGLVFQCGEPQPPRVKWWHLTLPYAKQVGIHYMCANDHFQINDLC